MTIMKFQNVSGQHAIDLVDFMRAIGDVAAGLEWRILELEAMGDISEFWPRGMLDLETTVAGSIGGLRVSWEQLIRLSEMLDQTLHCRIKGVSSAIDIAVCLEDSTFWTIETNDMGIAQGVREKVPVPAL